jgi:hypothetical protein
MEQYNNTVYRIPYYNRETKEKHNELNIHNNIRTLVVDPHRDGLPVCGGRGVQKQGDSVFFLQRLNILQLDSPSTYLNVLVL